MTIAGREATENRSYDRSSQKRSSLFTGILR